MDVVRTLLLILHFVGLASLLGGFLVQMKALKPGTGVINPAMLHGALTQLVTGILLVGLREMTGGDINMAKMIVKLAVLVVIFIPVIAYWRKPKAPSWALIAIGALTVANIAIAVAWR